MTALYSGVLNARGRFFAAAMAPAFLNIVFVGALAYVLLADVENSEEAGILLAVATLVGGTVVYRAGDDEARARPGVELLAGAGPRAGAFAGDDVREGATS